MEVEIALEGRTYRIVFAAADDGWTAAVDGVERPIALLEDGAVAVGDGVVRVEDVQDGHVRLDGVATTYRIEGLQGVAGAELDSGGRGGRVRAPMTGRLVRIAVAEGDTVEKGDVLFVLEAMKMQNEVRAPMGGTVVAVHGKEGEALEPQRVVVELEG